LTLASGGAASFPISAAQLDLLRGCVGATLSGLFSAFAGTEADVLVSNVAAAGVDVSLLAVVFFQSTQAVADSNAALFLNLLTNFSAGAVTACNRAGVAPLDSLSLLPSPPGAPAAPTLTPVPASPIWTPPTPEPFPESPSPSPVTRSKGLSPQTTGVLAGCFIGAVILAAVLLLVARRWRLQASYDRTLARQRVEMGYLSKHQLMSAPSRFQASL